MVHPASNPTTLPLATLPRRYRYSSYFQLFCKLQFLPLVCFSEDNECGLLSFVFHIPVPRIKNIRFILKRIVLNECHTSVDIKLEIVALGNKNINHISAPIGKDALYLSLYSVVLALIMYSYYLVLFIRII